MAKTSSPVSSREIGSASRQSIIAVLGHVDHGKSSLLDFIRKTNVVDGEAGGITQRISAYEVTVASEAHEPRTITFLDTPGHAAFSGMRERGVLIADIAVLVVSAEDGVKQQTVDAWKVITDRKIPYVVAINKIDKPGADIQKTKNSLVEHGIYIEGYGGEVPCVEISAKTGQGVDFLLETLALLGDMQDLTARSTGDASGFVLESFLDAKRGISATLIIKDGVMPKSGLVLAGTATSPIRIVEDFQGKLISGARAGQAVKVTGFTAIPRSGSMFIASGDKKHIEELQEEAIAREPKDILDPRLYRDAKVVIPLVIKADSLGTLDALLAEVKKKETKDIKVKVIGKGVGTITEGDIMLASHDDDAVILGFAVPLDNKARLQAERFALPVHTFDIIYKLTEFVDELIESRLPYEEVETVSATLKILKTFSIQKEIHVVGGKVETGTLTVGSTVKIVRRGTVLGRGKIVELQTQKIRTKEVQEGNECGISLETKIEMIASDVLEQITIERKKM